jgi:hypothetical protein
VDPQLARARRAAAAHLDGLYGMALETVERWTALGDAEGVCQHLDAYVHAGVEEMVLMPLGGDPLGQIERLADVRARLTEGVLQRP